MFFAKVFTKQKHVVGYKSIVKPVILSRIHPILRAQTDLGPNNHSKYQHGAAANHRSLVRNKVGIKQAVGPLYRQNSRPPTEKRTAIVRKIFDRNVFSF